MILWATTNDDLQAANQWLAQRVPDLADGGVNAPYTFAAVMGEKEAVKAVVAFHEYYPRHRTIQLSMASESPLWARPPAIAELLRFPFEHLDCFKVWTATPSGSERVIALNAHLGFKPEAVLEHQRGPHNHVTIMSMTQPMFAKSRWSMTDG